MDRVNLESDQQNGTATLYQGGEVASSDAAPRRADVLVGAEGEILGVGEALSAPDGAEVVDCSAKLLVPGMFDLHVHACEPGREDREDIGTCSEAAIAGGITGIVLMPDASPAIDSSGMVQSVLDSAAKARIEVHTAGAITRGRGGEELSGIAGMKAKGVRMLTDADLPVSNPLVLRRAMEYARDMGVLLASHCETLELSGAGAVHEGALSYQLGVPGIPAISEEICVYRDLRLAQFTNCPIHIQQLSTAKAMKAVRYFKEQDVQVTCEVSPHHLIFSQDDLVDYDTNLKVNPPLRPEDDRERLVQGLIDGTIDCIASDHSPRTKFEKNMAFGEAPFGMTGLETAVLALHHHLIKPGILSWEILISRYSDAPRRVLGLPQVSIAEGEQASFFVFDPSATTPIEVATLQSKSHNTPFLGRELDGRIERVELPR